MQQSLLTNNRYTHAHIHTAIGGIAQGSFPGGLCVREMSGVVLGKFSGTREKCSGNSLKENIRKEMFRRYVWEDFLGGILRKWRPGNVREGNGVVRRGTVGGGCPDSHARSQVSTWSSCDLGDQS